MSQRNANRKLAQQALQQVIEKAAEGLSAIPCSCGCHSYMQGVSVKYITKERISLMGGPPITGNIVFQVPGLFCIKCGEPFQEPKEERKLS